MFIGPEPYSYSFAPLGATCGRRVHCAPLERGFLRTLKSYKHAAPPEKRQVSQLYYSPEGVSSQYKPFQG
jgi:hypothetical protein